MCLQPMKIKAVHAGAPVIQFVSCGHCDQCRRIEKSGWSFRLALELQHRLDAGFEIGFCTLTYNDAHLPLIPFECFRDGKEYREIPCFNKNQMRKFIRNLRTKLYDDYGVTDLVYFLGSEFGEKKGRPHYHFLVCYPKCKINYRQMHSLIKDLWLKDDNGYIFPEFPDPTRKYGDELEKPFKVDASKGAYLCAKYVTKYVCKDVGFFNSFSDCRIVDKKNQGVKVPKFNLFGILETENDGTPKYETAYQVFLRCRPFHLQSRSLGWNFFKNLSEKDKIFHLKEGVKFLGEEHRQKLPVYIKNKLIFDNIYCLEFDKDGNEKRVVIREANDFFFKHASEIFNLKVSAYERFFTSLREESFWRARKADESIYYFCNAAFDYLCNSFGLSIFDVSRYYLSYFGVPLNRCFDFNLESVWMQRYSDEVKIDTDKLIDGRFKNEVDSVLRMILSCVHFASTDDDEMTKKVNDFKKRKRECLENVKN